MTQEHHGLAYDLTFWLSYSTGRAVVLKGIIMTHVKTEVCKLISMFVIAHNGGGGFCLDVFFLLVKTGNYEMLARVNADAYES